LVIYSLLGLVVLLVSIIAAHYFAEDLMGNAEHLSLVQTILIISAISLALEFPAKAFPGISSAYMRYDVIAFVRLCKSIVDAILIYVFISNGYGLVAMACITLITGMISTAIYVRFTTSLFKQLSISRQSVDLATLKDVYHFSKWVFVLDTNTMLRSKMDIWFIAFYLSSAVLTVYYVAVRLVEYAVSFLNQATGFSGPIFTEYYAKGEKEKLIRSINLFVKTNLLLASVLFLAFSLLGYSFIRLWMGDKFPAMDAYFCLLLMALGRFAVYFAEPFQSMLLTLNRHNAGAWASLVETMTSAVLLWLLVPNYGILRAAIAVTGPLLIGRLIFMPIYVNWQINIALRNLALRVFIFAATSFGIGILLYKGLPQLQKISWLELILAAPALALIQMIIGVLLFNSGERIFLKNQLHNWLESRKRKSMQH